MWRHLASNTLTFLIVALFLAAGLVGWGTSQYSARGPLTEAICLQVPSGTNMRRVSQTLDRQGAISSPEIFRIGADYAGKSGQLKAGSFLVPEGASMSEIVDIVTRGGANTCGTVVVYRIGVTRTLAEVRELDPATNDYVEVVQFDPAVDAAPAEYEAVKADPDTRYQVTLAEGVTSWQIATALSGLDVLDGKFVDGDVIEAKLESGEIQFAKG